MINRKKLVLHMNDDKTIVINTGEIDFGNRCVYSIEDSEDKFNIKTIYPFENIKRIDIMEEE